MELNDEEVSRGAIYVLEQGLQTRENHVLLITDEFSGSAAECIAEVARRNVRTTADVLVVDAAQQSMIAKRDGLPSEIRSAIDRASRIVVIHEMRPDTVAFRLLVLKYSQNG